MSPTSQPAKHGGALSVLFAVCLAALTLPLSFSGGAIATPAIGRDLAGSAAMVTWITNAFMLTFGSLLLTAGTLADRFGRRRIFAGGVALFVAASIASIFAPTILAIDLLRAVQGVGAAAALPILVQVYFNAGLAYWLSRRFGVAWCVATVLQKIVVSGDRQNAKTHDVLPSLLPR